MSLVDLAKQMVCPSDLLLLSRHWRKEYITRLDRRLQALLAKLGGQHDLSMAYRISTEASISRWITHPEAANAILRNESITDAQLEVLTRIYLCTLDEKQFGPMDRLRLKRAGFRRQAANLHGIEIDETQNAAFIPQTGYRSKLTPVANSLGCREKLDEALLLLSRCDHHAYQFVVENTRYLALRDDEENVRSFCSSSYGGYPGLSLLVNVCNERIDDVRLIDALYHEAIHSLIYRYEETQRPLLSELPPMEISLTSPWTDSNLTVDQYVQACFVWWGLFNLWRVFRDISGVAILKAQQMKTRAEMGFRSQPLDILVKSPAYRFVHPDTLSAIATVQALFAQHREFGVVSTGGHESVILARS